MRLHDLFLNFSGALQLHIVPWDFSRLLQLMSWVHVPSLLSPSSLDRLASSHNFLAVVEQCLSSKGLIEFDEFFEDFHVFEIPKGLILHVTIYIG
jgi:hypothetical protein